jgi:hypothetical protein
MYLANDLLPGFRVTTGVRGVQCIEREIGGTGLLVVADDAVRIQDLAYVGLRHGDLRSRRQSPERSSGVIRSGHLAGGGGSAEQSDRGSAGAQQESKHAHRSSGTPRQERLPNFRPHFASP